MQTKLLRTRNRKSCKNSTYYESMITGPNVTLLQHFNPKTLQE